MSDKTSILINMGNRMRAWYFAYKDLEPREERLIKADKEALDELHNLLEREKDNHGSQYMR